MIKLKSIYKSFDKKQIIQGFNFTIEQGDFVIIKGSSGKGKSSLLNIIGLLEDPDDGEVIFNDKVIRKENDKIKFKRNDIAYIYQNYGHLENETILKNLTLPLNVSKKDTSRIEEVIQRVGLSNLDLKSKVYTCSGGEQQRIAIARAILKEPTVIIADEPTGNLDEENSLNIMNIFKELNSKGITVIMATHEKAFFDIGNETIDMDLL
ncbi:ATP-binding cassette domain-containing protein [Mammaliicoccus sciuri]|uniref:ATP-binding cassette domain-containing protein n=1 Tax=Mammaliicoccus sciuri TaxID=1296 RepID=UPI000E67F476|nr:ATP-binding cassette domain-containing protein [Mammaliicoccus sciuri]RIN85774.1 ATP-binding cassette domain-containing protein [Mammaliicoccus sciuri]RIO02639.1 ATP-binding cassette domain-containing protein [Mammaliicoccus sciuri]RIO10775.1 ATP-binding cassette domain-containing protein [Mammaliicoccus sciuri]RIO16360.1 ATP-binding cassette domain-containing protein [Mammaliicoccus sciuri]